MNSKEELWKALKYEYDRCLGIMDEHGEEEDEFKAAQQQMNRILEKMQAYYDTETKEQIKVLEGEQNDKRNEAQLELEKEKKNVSKKQVLFEFGKILLTAGLSFKTYDFFQKRVLKFEETGRVCSTAGRELHLPRLK